MANSDTRKSAIIVHVEADDVVTPWGVRADGFSIIVWAPDRSTAEAIAVEWVDYTDHVGVAAAPAEQLGEPRPWSEVEPLWVSSDSTAVGAARDRAARMRALLGAQGWAFAIHYRLA